MSVVTTIHDEHGNVLEPNSEPIYQATHDLLLRIDRLMQDHDSLVPDDVREEFRKARKALGRPRVITGRALDEFSRKRRQAEYEASQVRRA